MDTVQPAVRHSQRHRLWRIVRRAGGPARLLKEALIHFDRDGGFVLAGHIAYMSVLSLFPFLIFLFGIAGLLGQTEQGREFVAYGLSQLPPEVARVLARPIGEVLSQSGGGVLTFGVLGTLWTASSGLEAARGILNRAFGVTQGPPFWRSRIQSVLLIIIISFLVPIGMSLLVIGPVVWNAIQRFIDVPPIWAWVWLVLRYSLSAALLFATISALYFVLPHRRLRPRWVFPGALMTVVLWLLLGTLFSLYLAYFGRYSVTYGSLGGVMVALIFFYMTGVIFIFGAELNAAIARAEGRAAHGSKAPAVV
jgi:membrane protein